MLDLKKNINLSWDVPLSGLVESELDKIEIASHDSKFNCISERTLLGVSILD